MGGEYALRRRQSADAEAKRAAPPAPAEQASGARPAGVRSGKRRIDLSGAIREKMESAFGMDMSSLRLSENPALEEFGAEAIAQGDRIDFAPGVPSPGTRSGQELLGHELSHIAGQARGEIQGRGLLQNRGLEDRADREGALAAAGETVYSGPAAVPIPAAAAPMQAKLTAREWTNIALDTAALGTDIDSLLTTDYEEKQEAQPSGGEQKQSANSESSSEAPQEQPGVPTTIKKNLAGLNHDTTGGKANDYAAAGVNTLAGLTNTGLGIADTAGSAAVGDRAGTAAGIFDSAAGLSDAAGGALSLTDLIGYKGSNKGLQKTGGWLGAGSGALRAVSGGIAAFSSRSTKNNMEQNAQSARMYAEEDKNDEVRKAFRQTGRNAKTDMLSGFMKMGTGLLKGAGSVVSTLFGSKTGTVVGKGLNILGDGLSIFNTFYTSSRRRSDRAETLNEAFGDNALESAITGAQNEDQTKDEKRAAKTGAIKRFIRQHGDKFTDADKRALLKKDHLKRKDVLAALSRRRAALIADGGVGRQEAGRNETALTGSEAAEQMGIHSDNAETRQAGILSRLLGGISDNTGEPRAQAGERDEEDKRQ